MAKKPKRGSGALTGAKGRRKAARKEVKRKGRYSKDYGMPPGNYIKTRTGKKVQRKKPPKSMK
jgi:hypothetical protein